MFPIGWMYYFGTNLEERFRVPDFWPKEEQSHKIPIEKSEIEKELARMKQDKERRLLERQQRANEAESTGVVASSSAGASE